MIILQSKSERFVRSLQTGGAVPKTAEENSRNGGEGTKDACGTAPNGRRVRRRLDEMQTSSLYNYKTNQNERNKNSKGGMMTMKKFLSMVMAAAMVVSLVPATAFAAKTT